MFFTTKLLIKCEKQKTKTKTTTTTKNKKTTPF